MMEGAGGSGEKFDLSLKMNGLSSDLLHKFMKKRSHYPNENEIEELEENDEEIELSLGLSMNGRFGVDPTQKRLKRSSSISDFAFAVGVTDNEGDHQARGAEFERHAPLARTHSLPIETEEEWRRRKELQFMRRMEARKKRMEKLKNGRVMRDKDNHAFADFNNNGSGLREVVSGQRVENATLCRIEKVNVMPSKQGSIEPERSGSSGVSEGAKQVDDAPPSNLPCSQDSDKPKPASGASDRDAKGPASESSLKNPMLDMPYVTTKDVGANGQKIEGFLYRYRKGEEVRIVCVCHGMFLTPAEFIRHGGGDDVEHPLKHIVVNPFPLL